MEIVISIQIARSPEHVKEVPTIWSSIGNAKVIEFRTVPIISVHFYTVWGQNDCH